LGGRRRGLSFSVHLLINSERFCESKGCYRGSVP
jgi:hypothetical protein